MFLSEREPIYPAAGRPPSPLGGLDNAFADHAAALTALRRLGVTKTLSDDELGRVFGLGFALEQLHRDLQDLVDRGAELAGQGPADPA